MTQCEIRYKYLRSEIKNKLKILDIAMSRHAGEFKAKGAKNYGYVGDLGRIYEVVSELDNFVKENSK